MVLRTSIIILYYISNNKENIFLYKKHIFLYFDQILGTKSLLGI